MSKNLEDFSQEEETDDSESAVKKRRSDKIVRVSNKMGK